MLSNTAGLLFFQFQMSMSATHLIMVVNRHVLILLDHTTVIAGTDTLWTAMAKHVL